MVVDALRESFIDGEFINFVGEYPGYRMQIFKDLHNLQPNNLKMFTSIADMPTITNQRIKALTTGNIPTLFDMGGNSGSKEQVIEDSLVHQANYLKVKIVAFHCNSFVLNVKFFRKTSECTEMTFTLDCSQICLTNMKYFLL